jgi:hypothetical protein
MSHDSTQGLINPCMQTNPISHFHSWLQKIWSIFPLMLTFLTPKTTTINRKQQTLQSPRNSHATSNQTTQSHPSHAIKSLNNRTWCLSSVITEFCNHKPHMMHKNKNPIFTNFHNQWNSMQRDPNLTHFCPWSTANPYKYHHSFRIKPSTQQHFTIPQIQA